MIVKQAYTDPLKINSSFFQHQQHLKKTEPLLRQVRAISNISNTCITKTITNYFLHPEKIPKAIEERQFFKCTATRPFFAKNRKIALSKQKDLRKQSFYNENSTLLDNSSGFNNALKAKSTVIKQNKLQQFYISREGRKEFQQKNIQEQQKFKPNLFRPNFSKKKTKTRRNSLNSQLRHAQSLQLLIDEPTKQKKLITFESGPNQESESRILKQKIENLNIMLQKIKRPKKQQGYSILRCDKLKKKAKTYDKQNTQFDLQPWQNSANDDIYF